MAVCWLACASHKSGLLWLTLQLTILLQKQVWNRGGADGAADAEHALHVMFLTARSEFFDSSGVIPAVRLAEEHINSRPDLLPGYQLHIGSVGDSQVREIATCLCICYIPSYDSSERGECQNLIEGHKSDKFVCVMFSLVHLLIMCCV